MNIKKQIKKLKAELKSLKYRIQLDHDATERQIGLLETAATGGDPVERISE